MLLARGLEGVAFALGAIAGPALANRSATRRDLGFVMGLTAAWIPIGQLLATGLALVLPNWQMLWLAGAGATCAGTLGVALRRHEPSRTPGATGARRAARARASAMNSSRPPRSSCSGRCSISPI